MKRLQDVFWPSPKSVTLRQSPVSGPFKNDGSPAALRQHIVADLLGCLERFLQIAAIENALCGNRRLARALP